MKTYTLEVCIERRTIVSRNFYYFGKPEMPAHGAPKHVHFDEVNGGNAEYFVKETGLYLKEIDLCKVTVRPEINGTFPIDLKPAESYYAIAPSKEAADDGLLIQFALPSELAKAKLAQIVELFDEFYADYNALDGNEIVISGVVADYKIRAFTKALKSVLW